MLLGDLLKLIPYEKIPWSLIIGKATETWSRSTQEREKLEENQDDNADLRLAIEKLQADNINQQEYITNLALQVKDLSNALRVMSVRMYVSFGITFVTLLLVIVFSL
jgi:type II secretory pathway pseudopilin PulG